MWILMLCLCLVSRVAGSGADAVGNGAKPSLRRASVVEANEPSILPEAFHEQSTGNINLPRTLASLQRVTVTQSFTQTLEVWQPQEFSEEEVQSYELLMVGYTQHLGSQVAAPEIVTSCDVIGQDLESLDGPDGIQKHMLTISFAMSYETHYGHGIEEYPALFGERINTGLYSNMQDMHARSLPVEAVLDVVAVGDMTIVTESLPPPTVNPTAAPTPSPSTSPSGGPSRAPTSAPTRPSIVESTGATDVDVSPADETTAETKRAYAVPSMMVLYGSDLLDADATQAWMAVTQDRIRTEASAILDGRGDELVVTVSLDNQEVLESRGELVRRRRLESDPPPRLRIDFTTNIEFNSEEDAWDANKMVSSCFETLEQEEEYMDSLRTADATTFEDVQEMIMEVAGELVTERPEPKEAAVMQSVDNGNEDDGDGNTPLIAGAAAAVGVILLMTLVASVLVVRNRRKRRKKTQPKTIEQGPPPVAGGVAGGAAGVLDDEEHSKDTSDSHDEEEEEDAIYHSVSAVAPPGKLGLVIANPWGDMPMVMQMKEDSVLQGRVQVGDLLLTVDEVDCRGMSSSAVSELIGERSQQQTRILLLLREQ